MRLTLIPLAVVFAVSIISCTGAGNAPLSPSVAPAPMVKSLEPPTQNEPATLSVRPRTTVPTHIITADYLGAPWGTTRVAYSAAAPYLTWAETGTADANAIHDAGMKTMTYITPYTEAVGSMMYTRDNTTYAHTCTGARTYFDWDRAQQYVMNPSSTSMKDVYINFVKTRVIALGHFDALFADNAGSLAAMGRYSPIAPTYPCSYSDAGWIAAETAFNQISPLPIVFNGLDELNGKSPSLSISLLNGSNTIGGNFEQCYTNRATPKETSWLWQTVETTEMLVAARHKLFECYANNFGEASSMVDARVYVYASFLLTYDPNTSVYRAAFSTPTGFHVLPESGLVALSPTVTATSTVLALRQSGGTYARQFHYCYLRGRYIGPCAAVVNSDSVTHPFPFTTYHHTLLLEGSGVLDHGAAYTDGPAPPTYLPAGEARIALP